jgi:hypothetical protein
MTQDIYKVLMDIKEGQGKLMSRADATHDLMAELRSDHKGLDGRVTALEHLKIAIVAGAGVAGGILGLTWDRIKAALGHLIA